MSVDGTDCRIREPQPFHSRWYSHKFKSAALRYEIEITVDNGTIAWAHGPFAAGSWPDLKIFRSGLKHYLDEEEKVVADDGYPDRKCLRLAESGADVVKRIRARHETLNGRLKNFGCVGSLFRHKKELHSLCFFAVLNVVQLSLQNGHPLFEL